ncbi:MAG: DUF2846 domain-containing protein [Spirochaetales bacterium]|nr:DUF2846 domain-containing protein [Spirochaetales bacterium]
MRTRPKKDQTHTRYWLAVALLLLLTGCTAIGGQQFTELTPPSGKAVIYIYRTRTFVGGAVSYPIFINNQKVTTLPHTAYYAFPADPGEVFITAKTPENEAHIKLTVKAGQEYYIKGGTATGVFAGRATLNQVHPDQGSEEIKECAYYPAHDER